MTPSARILLDLKHPPIRVTAVQTGTYLGFTVDEVRLVASAQVLQRLLEAVPGNHRRRLLPPAQRLRALGSPAKQAVKYFATCEILSRAQDRDWLDRAQCSIRAYWKAKGIRRQTVATKAKSKPEPSNPNPK